MRLLPSFIPEAPKRVAFLVILLCAVPAADRSPAATPREGSPTLAELVERNTAAMGGRKAIEATRSVTYHLRIQEPSFTVEGDYVADREGRMRIDVYADGKRVYTEARDGKDSWQMGQDGVAQTSSGPGAAALWHGTQFPGKLLGLHEMAAHGHTLEPAGDETLDGTLYHVIKLTYSDGFTTWLYLDSRTSLIARQRDERALHPDADPAVKWVETRMEDYRPVEGVMRPRTSRQIDLRTGATVQTATVTSIEVNVAPAADLFRFGTDPPPRKER